ncbi:hypothetical protein GGI1_21172 [Acidithiobacillus sp. GGI-221]|nr:hypothetical protein GGI1_21172 [Acidithiobacillus sp. GGI-221]
MNRNFADRVACETFEEILRNIIRDPSNGAAHAAAECLFAVRKLENALTAAPSNVVIQPVGKADI